jgi:hypothetical protein
MVDKNMIKKLMGLGDDARSARGIFSRGVNVYKNGTNAAQSSGRNLGEDRDTRRIYEQSRDLAKSNMRKGKTPNSLASWNQKEKQKSAAASKAAITRRLTRRVI